MGRGVVLLLVMSACVADVPELSSHRQEAGGGVVPWKQPQRWPYQIESPRLVVHYQDVGDLAMAQSVLADVEDAWTVQMTQQGARPPLDDGGLAGPDGRFDVYLFRGVDTLYVNSVAANAATTWDDYSTAMVLDPWGKYGGAEQRPNIFHELRHASQAVDDWYETPQVFESEATLWEVVQYGYDRLPYVWADFQARPEWCVFRSDNYGTWYMYGAALYLAHLRKTVFGNSLGWTNEMWLRSRNPAGTNEPDFADALQLQLAARGTSLFDTVVTFARARWYTGARANPAIIDGAAAIAEVATRAHVRAAGATRTSVVANPQLLGTNYVVVTAAPTDGTSLRVSLSNIGTNARPVVQVVNRTAGDSVLDLSSGSAVVPLAGGQLVLAVTMLPANGAFDPDTVGTQQVKATINLDRM